MGVVKRIKKAYWRRKLKKRYQPRSRNLENICKYLVIGSSPFIASGIIFLHGLPQLTPINFHSENLSEQSRTPITKKPMSGHGVVTNRGKTKRLEFPTKKLGKSNRYCSGNKASKFGSKTIKWGGNTTVVPGIDCGSKKNLTQRILAAVGDEYNITKFSIGDKKYSNWDEFNIPKKQLGQPGMIKLNVRSSKTISTLKTPANRRHKPKKLERKLYSEGSPERVFQNQYCSKNATREPTVTISLFGQGKMKTLCNTKGYSVIEKLINSDPKTFKVIGYKGSGDSAKEFKGLKLDELKAKNYENIDIQVTKKKLNSTREDNSENIANRQNGLRLSEKPIKTPPIKRYCVGEANLANVDKEIKLTIVRYRSNNNSPDSISKETSLMGIDCKEKEDFDNIINRLNKSTPKGFTKLGYKVTYRDGSKTLYTGETMDMNDFKNAAKVVYFIR